MSTGIRGLINILQQKPDPTEEQREYNETSKEELWADRKKFRNAIYVLSYACGCALFASQCDGVLPFPEILPQILCAIVFGVVFGFVIGAIVLTVFGRRARLSLPLKMLTLVFIPVILLAFIHLR